MWTVGAVLLVTAICAMRAAAEEVDPSLDWSPSRVLRSRPRAVLGLQAFPGRQLELEAGEARVAKRQAEGGLDWQLLLEDGGGEARTRVKRGQPDGQLVLNSDPDRGDIEAMQEESANDGSFDISLDGGGVEDGPADWLERRESPGMSGLAGGVPEDEDKEEQCSGGEEERGAALGKNDAKPPK